MRAITEYGSISDSYKIKNHDDSINEIDLEISTKCYKNSILLVVPRCGMQQDHNKLYLDSGAWGQADYPILLVNPTTNLKIKHDLHNGRFQYFLE
jgi:hypothetical protein